MNFDEMKEKIKYIEFGILDRDNRRYFYLPTSDIISYRGFDFKDFPHDDTDNWDIIDNDE